MCTGGLRYVITKFSRMDGLPNFLTHGAPQARASGARELRYNLFDCRCDHKWKVKRAYQKGLITNNQKQACL